jgi:hypothetical protein
MKSVLRLVLPVLLLLGGLPAFAQPDTVVVQPRSESQGDGQAWAEIRKPYFRNTRNDSLFVVNNSDEPFRYDYYSQAEDLGVFSRMFFDAKVGDVVGPLFLEGYAILYKIAGYDSSTASGPASCTSSPTARAAATASRPLKSQPVPGPSAAGRQLRSYSRSTSRTEDGAAGDLGWLWQEFMIGPSTKPWPTQKGRRTGHQIPWAHLVKVTEDKVLDRAGKVVPLMKKL